MGWLALVLTYQLDRSTPHEQDNRQRTNSISRLIISKPRIIFNHYDYLCKLRRYFLMNTINHEHLAVELNHIGEDHEDTTRAPQPRS